MTGRLQVRLGIIPRFGVLQDQYMVWTMRRLACHASRVVAVVGAGHLQVNFLLVLRFRRSNKINRRTKQDDMWLMHAHQWTPSERDTVVDLRDFA